MHADILVDVVDENDMVVGSAPRKGIHKTDKLHRSVHIFLINSSGRIWLEKRAENTDTFPGYYNSSAAGHVSSGESYEEGALREIEEELGIKNANIKKMHKLAASKETSNEFVTFFIVHSDEKPTINKDATDALNSYSIKEIDEMIAKGNKFVPIFMKLYNWHKINAANSH